MRFTTILLISVCASLSACSNEEKPEETTIEHRGFQLTVSEDGTFRVRAPGVKIDVGPNGEAAVVDIDTPGARIHADDSGRVDIRAKGVVIDIDGNEVDSKDATVRIDAGEAHLYADESGRLDIRAPGVSIQAAGETETP